MSIRLLNTYSRQLEEFTPIDPAGKAVTMYTCGPTVYNLAHIGNFRAYVFEDLLQRHLEFRGYRVERAMNLTDVDDKTIRGCRNAGTSLAAFTQPFKDAFFADLKTLRIKPATHFPAATEPQYITRMIDMIDLLVKRGYAYQAEDRSVYFRLSKFPDYGKLAHLNLDELRPSGRVRSDEYEKESIGDFALWKGWDEADGDVAWESPWGRGRPGWHIECSAMATALLGPKIDIHCGGVDNIFPHHEAEIAQSECCTGERFVRYWLHCAHLMVEGQKMAKSLGNFFTLRDLLTKGHTGRELRYALISVNYRLPLNFTFEGLAAARQALGRIDEWVDRLRKANPKSENRDPESTIHDPQPTIHNPPLRAFVSSCEQSSQDRRAEGGDRKVECENGFLAHAEKFAACLDDDLNIAGALGHLFETIRESNRALDQDSLSASDIRALLDWWDRINTVLAIEPDAVEVPDEVVALAEKRSQARASKDWAGSDAIRKQIEALGWQVKDTKEGQKISQGS